jgi:ADP-ribosylglycohydrolase
MQRQAKAGKVLGAVLGLALGDALGAPYEGGFLERALWRLLGRTGGKQRWTDDTQMTLDVLDSLAANGSIDQDDLARRFAQSYRWSRGYGPGAARVLKRIRRGQPWAEACRAVYPEGSFGNGGAMRSPVVGLFFAEAPDCEIAEAASAVAAVTHAHPLAQEGAALVALATALAYQGLPVSDTMARLLALASFPEFSNRLRTAEDWLRSRESVSARKIETELGNGMAATKSCVTAIYLALSNRDQPFMALLESAMSLGGDVDTIAAMAGAIWGASRGAGDLPEEGLRELEQRERLTAASQTLADAMRSRLSDS